MTITTTGAPAVHGLNPDGMQADGLSIIVCALNAEDRVRRFIAAVHRDIRRLSFPVELVFIDDGSTDGTADAARELGTDVRVVEHGANRGLSAARNSAVLVSRYPWLLFCDDDVELDAETVAELHHRRRNRDIIVPELRGISGELQNGVTSAWRRLDWKFEYHSEPLCEVAFPIGACFLVKKETVVRAGGFDERFRLYYEDTAFGAAVREAGGRTFMEQGVLVRHHLHGGDVTAERALRNARQVFEERWRFSLVALSGRRRLVSVLLGLPRSVIQSVRVRSVSPVAGYIKALRDARRLLGDRARYDLRSRTGDL